MPPIPFRQPRARRIAELGLAVTVALSVVVAPGLFRDGGDKTLEAAAASAPTDSPAETATTLTLTGPVDNSTVRDEHAMRTRLANDSTYRMQLAYASATPEERAALDTFFAPPPPAPAPQPEPTPAPKASAAAAPAVSSGSVWDRLAFCESHNNWATHTANGFSGGLQFADQTWRAYGGTAYAPKAWQASREQQIVIAEKVLASAGWKAWPACSRKLGLR